MGWPQLKRSSGDVAIPPETLPNLPRCKSHAGDSSDIGDSGASLRRAIRKAQKACDRKR